MGKDSTATLSYGFIIPQSSVLALLQKLQNTKEKVTNFDYQDGEPELLEQLLNKHFEERELDKFELSYLTMGDYEFVGLAILFSGIIKRAMVWGFGSRTFKPLSSELFDQEQVQEANAAFKRLAEDSLFKDLEIEVNPEWLLGCNMSC